MTARIFQRRIASASCASTVPSSSVARAICRSAASDCISCVQAPRRSCNLGQPRADIGQLLLPLVPAAFDVAAFGFEDLADGFFGELAGQRRLNADRQLGLLPLEVGDAGPIGRGLAEALFVARRRPA